MSKYFSSEVRVLAVRNLAPSGLALFILLLTANSSYAQPNSWRGFVPLRSTEDEVEKVFGKGEREGLYIREDVSVSFIYSSKPCQRGWRVPLGTVLSIYVSLRMNHPKLADLNLNLSEYKILPAGDVADARIYSNESAGLSYYVGGSGAVTSISYFPSSDDSRFKCAEGTERVITRQLIGNEPYEVGEFDINGRGRVKAGVPFKAEDDWLTRLSFPITNISSNVITYIQVIVVFPETRLTGSLLLYQFDIGQPLQKPVEGAGHLLLGPGDVTSFELNAARETVIRTGLGLRNHQPGALTKIEVWLQEVHFLDHTRWLTGELFYLNAATNHWVKIPPK